MNEQLRQLSNSILNLTYDNHFHKLAITYQEALIIADLILEREKEIRKEERKKTAEEIYNSIKDKVDTIYAKDYCDAERQTLLMTAYKIISESEK